MRRGRPGGTRPWRHAAYVVAVAAVTASAGALLALYGGTGGGGWDGDAGAPQPITAGALRSGGSPVLGNPSAPVTILEYGDYQCTFCYRFHQSTMGELRDRYVKAGSVNVVFRDFALNGHDSVMAAEASRCAGDQGKYWGYHDALYDNWGGERTGWVTEEALQEFAAGVGLDTAVFADCLKGSVHRDAVIKAYRDGQLMGIDATPSFIVFNDHRAVRITGNQPLAVFERVIDGMLPGPQA